MNNMQELIAKSAQHIFEHGIPIKNHTEVERAIMDIDPGFHEQSDEFKRTMVVDVVALVEAMQRKK